MKASHFVIGRKFVINKVIKTVICLKIWIVRSLLLEHITQPLQYNLIVGDNFNSKFEPFLNSKTPILCLVSCVRECGLNDRITECMKMNSGVRNRHAESSTSYICGDARVRVASARLDRETRRHILQVRCDRMLAHPTVQNPIPSARSLFHVDFPFLLSWLTWLTFALLCQATFRSTC